MKENKDVLILGIESSCDETSISVVKNGREILSNVISTQIEIHKQYGGVVPEIASRNHVLNIDKVYKQALNEAKVSMDDIDAIAVTYGAGLSGALIVGVSFAKALSLATQKPLIGVNHIEGHICANYLAHKNLEPPFVCLLASGGHTALLNIKDYYTRKLIKTTADDALGEAFDKVARACGMSYPGGPNVSRCAKDGKNGIQFITKPHAKQKDNFSYSGIKTAVVNYLHNCEQKHEKINIHDICCSFETQVVEQITDEAIAACKKLKQTKLAMCGGVSANATLRSVLEKKAKENGITAYFPPLSLCTDNGAMIASRGYYEYKNKNFADLSLSPKPSLSL